MHRYNLTDGKLLFSGGNAVAARILGICPTTGQPIERALPSLAYTEVPTRFVAAARNGVAWQGEVAHPAGRGTLAVQVFPVVPGEIIALFADAEQRRQPPADSGGESWYRTLVEHCPDVILRCNALGEVVFASDRWGQLSGYTPQSALGRGWLQAVHPEDRGAVIARWHEAASATRPMTSEFRLLTPDRHIVRVEIRIIPMRDGTRVTGFVGALLDITWRKRTERERDLLFQHSRDMLCIGSIEGFLEQVNPAWTDVLGWREDELTSRPWIDFVYEEDRERTLEADTRLRAGRDVVPHENRWRCRDGSLRWLRWSAVPLPEEKLIFAVASDVTAEHQEQKLRRLLEVTLQRSADPTFWTDAEGRLLYVNEAAQRALGFSVEELLSMRVWDVDVRLNPERWGVTRANVTRSGSLRVESEHRRKDGTLIPVDVSVHYFEFEGELRFVGIARDMTERRRQEEMRSEVLERERAARAALEEANHAKDRFLAVLSHELRTPLTPILSGVELLRGIARDERAASVLDTIQRNARHEAHLLEDLLDLSRLVRGTFALHRAPLLLEQVVTDAVQPYQAQARERQLRLEAHVQSGLWVMADADRLQQIITNLLTNALKFTPAGGFVHVEVKRIDGRARLVVEDSGIGIDPKRLPGLFDTMFQQEGGVQRRSGLGIGLALVRAFAEMHGASVSAHSGGEGLGSRFEVDLPLIATPTEVGAAAAATRASGPERPRDVLLVEDDTDTRELLAATLAGFNWHVSTAATGEEALAQLAHGYEPDIILADIGLPGIDGYEFLQKAHRQPRLRQTPAFAIIGYGQPKDVERAREAGFSELFVKPVDVRLLSERITTYPPRTARRQQESPSAQS